MLRHPVFRDVEAVGVRGTRDNGRHSVLRVRGGPLFFRGGLVPGRCRTNGTRAYPGGRGQERMDRENLTGNGPADRARVWRGGQDRDSGLLLHVSLGHVVGGACAFCANDFADLHVGLSTSSYRRRKW